MTFTHPPESVSFYSVWISGITTKPNPSTLTLNVMSPLIFKCTALESPTSFSINFFLPIKQKHWQIHLQSIENKQQKPFNSTHPSRDDGQHLISFLQKVTKYTSIQSKHTPVRLLLHTTPHHWNLACPPSSCLWWSTYCICQDSLFPLPVRLPELQGLHLSHWPLLLSLLC